jgi:Nucleotide-diphospho-sugar transferase
MIVFILSFVLVMRQGWKVYQLDEPKLLEGWEVYQMYKTKQHYKVKEEISHIDSLDVGSKNSLLSAAKDIFSKHGVVAIQLFNEGYIGMTKSWICNVKSFPGVLDRTLFIATDEVAYTALTDWDATLHVVHMDYKTPTDMVYGQHVYYSYMLFRTRLVCYLLANNISLWLIESDAVWLRDPSDEVFNTKGDIVTMSDWKPPSQHPQGGFQLLNSSNATLNVWLKLLKQQTEAVNSFQAGDDMGNAGNEQDMMKSLITSDTDLHVAWLDPKHFLSGMYYFTPDYAAIAVEPKVILNNFAVGNGAKISRAKEHGHWFLKDDGTCDANAAKILASA